MARTSYGQKLNNNRNLRYTTPEDVHTEVTLGTHVSGGEGDLAFGLDFTLRRQYKVASYGVQFSSEYSSVLHNSIALMGGLRFGNGVSFGIDALLGYGQVHEVVNSSNPTNGDSHEAKTSPWHPFAGVQAGLGVKLSQNVMLSLYGGYKHFFIRTSDHSFNLRDGWKVDSHTTDANRWFAGVSLSILLNEATQISGDNCWMGEIFGGYSNKGAVAGAKAVHFKRTSARIGRTLGVGTQYTIDGCATNEVFGQAGLQVLPQGAQSPIIFDVHVTLGLGQYARTIEGATEDISRFHMGSEGYAFGCSAKAHAGVSYHTNRFTIGAEGFVGGVALNGAKFTGSLGYHGETSPLLGLIYGTVITLGLAF